MNANVIIQRVLQMEIFRTDANTKKTALKKSKSRKKMEIMCYKLSIGYDPNVEKTSMFVNVSKTYLL